MPHAAFDVAAGIPANSVAIRSIPGYKDKSPAAPAADKHLVN
jgi:hypothetical protein